MSDKQQSSYHVWTDRKHYEGGGLALYSLKFDVNLHFGDKAEPIEIVTMLASEWERVTKILREVEGRISPFVDAEIAELLK